MTKLYKCDRCGKVSNYCRDVYFTWDSQHMSADLCDDCNKQIRELLKKLLNKDFKDILGLGVIDIA